MKDGFRALREARPMARGPTPRRGSIASSRNSPRASSPTCPAPPARDEDLSGPEPSLEKSELLHRLAIGVGRLRPEYRVVIALRYDAGLTYEEIGRNLSIPLNTVRTHLTRA